MEMGLIVSLSKYYCNNYFYTRIISQHINIMMFENWQRIKSIGLSASLADLKKLNKHENLTNIIKMKHKKFKG